METANVYNMIACFILSINQFIIILSILQLDYDVYKFLNSLKTIKTHSGIYLL